MAKAKVWRCAERLFDLEDVPFADILHLIHFALASARQVLSGLHSPRFERGERIFAQIQLFDGLCQRRGIALRLILLPLRTPAPVVNEFLVHTAILA